MFDDWCLDLEKFSEIPCRKKLMKSRYKKIRACKKIGPQISVIGHGFMFHWFIEVHQHMRHNARIQYILWAFEMGSLTMVATFGLATDWKISVCTIYMQLPIHISICKNVNSTYSMMEVWRYHHSARQSCAVLMMNGSSCWADYTCCITCPTAGATCHRLLRSLVGLLSQYAPMLIPK